LKLYSITDIGQRRQINQDYIYATGNPIGTLPNVFLLADGMGGHKAGDYASKTTVEIILKEVSDAKEIDAVAVIYKAIAIANHAIFQKSKEELFNGMGTTVVVATCEKQILKDCTGRPDILRETVNTFDLTSHLHS